MGLVLSFATKANHKVAGVSANTNYPDLSFSGKTLRFKVSKRFFDESGLSGNKSLSWVLALYEGKVILVTMEGNEGVTLKKTERGEKGQVFTAATLVEVLQAGGLLPETITDSSKGKFDLVALGEEVEGALEAYYVTVAEGKEDEEEEVAQATDSVTDSALGDEVAPLEEVATSNESLEASEGFGDDI